MKRKPTLSKSIQQSVLDQVDEFIADKRYAMKIIFSLMYKFEITPRNIVDQFKDAIRLESLINKL